MTNILVIHGHPNAASLSTALAEAYAATARLAGASVESLYLRNLRFDPILHHGYAQPQPLEADLQKAADAIVAASHVAWFVPCWWNGLPALTKGFIERVFTPGFAFKYEHQAKLPTKLLRGRSARVVASMDGPYLWHKLVNRSAFETAFVRSTLKFVGFGPVNTTIFYSVGTTARKNANPIFAKVRTCGTMDANARGARSPAPRLQNVE